MEIKRELDATEVFIADLIACSTCFGAPLCPSSGAQEYYTVVAAYGISYCGFSGSWSGVELRVVCPVCSMLQILLLAQHISGHHYAHHQELKSITQWLLPVIFRAVVFQVAGLVWS